MLTSSPNRRYLIIELDWLNNAMRQIVLDTETTGLEVELGHRIIEVAAIEMDNRVPTDRRFHHFVNPGREVENKALEVHGITNEFLESKPPFSAVAREFVDFIRGADLIIHNAEFDVGFLNHELKVAGEYSEPVEQLCNEIIDTIRIARELRPGRRNSLDALATEYGIDLSVRSKHGALVDAEILMKVYKAMTGGQTSMNFGDGDGHLPLSAKGIDHSVRFDGANLPVLRANDEELKLHEQWLDHLDSRCEGGSVWRRAQHSAAMDAFQAPKSSEFD